jgi:hypothetical protein
VRIHTPKPNRGKRKFSYDQYKILEKERETTQQPTKERVKEIVLLLRASAEKELKQRGIRHDSVNDNRVRGWFTAQRYKLIRKKKNH